MCPHLEFLRTVHRRKGRREGGKEEERNLYIYMKTVSLAQITNWMLSFFFCFFFFPGVRDRGGCGLGWLWGITGGFLCGDANALYLDWGGGTQVYTCRHTNLHVHCTHVNVLVLIFYHHYMKHRHWGKLDDKYKGLLCTIFADICESIIISQ